MNGHLIGYIFVVLGNHLYRVFNDLLRLAPLAVGIGQHTGPVVVGVAVKVIGGNGGAPAHGGSAVGGRSIFQLLAQNIGRNGHLVGVAGCGAVVCNVTGVADCYIGETSIFRSLCSIGDLVVVAAFLQRVGDRFRLCVVHRV